MGKKWWELLLRVFGEKPEKELLSEHEFLIELKREQMKATRAKRRLPIIFIEIDRATAGMAFHATIATVAACLKVSVRRTDICGLIKDGGTVGVVLTAIDEGNVDTAERIVLKKILKNLQGVGGEGGMQHITVITHLVSPDVDGAFLLQLYLKSYSRQRKEGPVNEQAAKEDNLCDRSRQDCTEFVARHDRRRPQL
jgi:hypothetical protein